MEGKCHLDSLLVNIEKKNFTILSSFSTVIVRATEKETGQKRQKTFSFCHTIYELLSFSPFSPTHRENGWTWRLFSTQTPLFSHCVFLLPTQSRNHIHSLTEVDGVFSFTFTEAQRQHKHTNRNGDGKKHTQNRERSREKKGGNLGTCESFFC